MYTISYGQLPNELLHINRLLIYCIAAKHSQGVPLHEIMSWSHDIFTKEVICHEIYKHDVNSYIYGNIMFQQMTLQCV